MRAPDYFWWINPKQREVGHWSEWIAFLCYVVAAILMFFTGS